MSLEIQRLDQIKLSLGGSSTQTHKPSVQQEFADINSILRSSVSNGEKKVTIGFQKEYKELVLGELLLQGYKSKFNLYNVFSNLFGDKYWVTISLKQ